EARSLFPVDFPSPIADPGRIGECEFMLISELRSQLIIHQPYNSLTHMHAPGFRTPEELAVAWSIVNDSFMTDLPLLYPSHVIAVTAALIPVVVRPMCGASAGNGGDRSNNS